VSEQLLDLIGCGVSRDVVVVWFAAKQLIANASASPERLETGGPEAADNVGGELAFRHGRDCDRREVEWQRRLCLSGGLAIEYGRRINCEYLDAGVKVVCVADEMTKSIYVYRAENNTTVAFDAELVLPELHADFRVPVRRFFE
jgi:hypothetical protein